MAPYTWPDWLRVTCAGVPTQIEGVSPDGERVYFRFRWGRATLDINDEQVWSESYGDSYSGCMDTDVAIRLITAVLAYRAAHAAALAELPLGEPRPLTEHEQALTNRWIVTAPPQD